MKIFFVLAATSLVLVMGSATQAQAQAQSYQNILDSLMAQKNASPQRFNGSENGTEIKPSLDFFDYMIDNVPYLNLEDITIADQVERMKRLQQNKNVQKLGDQVIRLMGESMEIIKKDVDEIGRITQETRRNGTTRQP